MSRAAKTIIPDNRQRSSDEIILACKEFGCPWDPYPVTVQEQDFRGRWVWMRKIRCFNCGSIKVEKYPVGDVYFVNRMSAVKYVRPPGWYEVELRFYWGGARAERARLGYLPKVEVSGPSLEEEQEDEDKDAQVLRLRGAS